MKPALMGLTVYWGHPTRNKKISSWDNTNVVTVTVGNTGGYNGTEGRAAVPSLFPSILPLSLSSFHLFLFLPIIFNIHQVARMLAVGDPEMSTTRSWCSGESNRGGSGLPVCMDPEEWASYTSEPLRSELKSWPSHLHAVWLQISYFISLLFCFLLCLNKKTE